MKVPCGHCKQGLIDNELCPMCNGTVLLDNDTNMDENEVVAPAEVPAEEAAPEVAAEPQVGEQAAPEVTAE